MLMIGPETDFIIITFDNISVDYRRNKFYVLHIGTMDIIKLSLGFLFFKIETSKKRAP